jgi:hypothetical protein
VHKVACIDNNARSDPVLVPTSLLGLRELLIRQYMTIGCLWPIKNAEQGRGFLGIGVLTLARKIPLDKIEIRFGTEKAPRHHTAGINANLRILTSSSFDECTLNRSPISMEDQLINAANPQIPTIFRKELLTRSISWR